MSRRGSFERRLEFLAVPHVTQLLIAGQICCYLLYLLRPEFLQAIQLQPARVWAGEWWRLFTFPISPTDINPLFLFFGILCFHFMATALESNLGTLRYNGFLLVSYLCSLAMALLYGWLGSGDAVVVNAFMYGSVFLAFAWLYPEFQIMILFVIPVKVKWIALLTVIGYAFAFSEGLLSWNQGGWFSCMNILAANLNLLLFFGSGFYRRLRSGHRRMAAQVHVIKQSHVPRHTCATCGATNLTHPERDFRYCTECDGTPAYCDQHLRGHEHRSVPRPLAP